MGVFVEEKLWTDGRFEMQNKGTKILPMVRVKNVGDNTVHTYTIDEVQQMLKILKGE